MWYDNGRSIIAANIEETLANLTAQGVSQDLLNRVRQLPNPGFYIAKLVKNPMLTEEALFNEVTKEPVIPPIEHTIATLFTPNLRQWAYAELRKLRYKFVGDDIIYNRFPNDTNHWDLRNIFGQIADWANHESQVNLRFQLATFNFEQALKFSDEWHKMMAGKGEGLFYTPYKRNSEGHVEDERVVYTFPNGYHISQLDNANDLKKEGYELNHCVGGYCKDVESGKTRIFSLRNEFNNPIATIELDGTDNAVEQIKAVNNSKPAKKDRLLIGEWLKSIDARMAEDSNAEPPRIEWGDHFSSLPYAFSQLAYGPGEYAFYEDEENSTDPEYGIARDLPEGYVLDVRDLKSDEFFEYIKDFVPAALSESQADKHYSSTESDLIETIGDIIIDHDTEILESYYRPLKFETIKNELFVFDLAENFKDSYQDALDALDDTKEETFENAAAGDYLFGFYYDVYNYILRKLPQKMFDLYYQNTQRNLDADIKNSVSDTGLPDTYNIYRNRETQPYLFLHRDQMGYGNTPTVEEFDENGWHYAKRMREMYRISVDLRKLLSES